MISRVGARVINHHSIKRPCGCCGLQSLVVLYWCERLSPRCTCPPSPLSPAASNGVNEELQTLWVQLTCPQAPGETLVTNEPKYKCRPATQCAAQGCCPAPLLMWFRFPSHHCNRTVAVSVTLHLLNNERSEERRSLLFAYFEYLNTEYRAEK